MQFMGEDFLLGTKAARDLYHGVAAGMPIIDYHCHLSPGEIADNLAFPNVGRLMLGGDHYKWRAMAACGFGNEFIRTSNDKDRFFAYAKCMPRLIGNPLYHWTHLELQRVFGIHEPLSENTAQKAWDRANEMLSADAFKPRGLIERFNVETVCTTDDPLDDLAHHKAIAGLAGFKTQVLPTFRPDKAFKAHLPGFAEFVHKLGELTGIDIRGTQDVIDALRRRAEYFHQAGARLSDHALDTLPFAGPDTKKADAAFVAVMNGNAPDAAGLEHYQTSILIGLGDIYAKLGWTQQYHIGALRNANTRMYERFGPDTGFDALSDAPVGEKLAKLLDAQELNGTLPRTILYTLNPGANYALAVIAGTFQGDVPGKVQFGSAWWFVDQLDGMREQITTLASVGALGYFVGMLTDSRSFTSYPRHEYFRRLLCDIVGGWVERGEYPGDEPELQRIIRGICYGNARDYFQFPTK